MADKPLSNDNTEVKMQMVPPYTMSAAVDLSTGHWVAANQGSNGMFVAEVRNVNSGNLVYDTEHSTNITIGLDNYDVLRVRLTRIRSNSTASGLHVHGYPLHVDP